MEKRLQRVRQTPKYMEKMLFVNHKEEQGLQRRLEAINCSSRIRGRELDRERLKVRNEWRYNSRLNHAHVAPMLEQIPVLLRRECPRTSESIDPVNVYLLKEYRRNSQIIPSILSSLSKDGESSTTDVTELNSRNSSPGSERRENLSADVNSAGLNRRASNRGNSSLSRRGFRTRDKVGNIDYYDSSSDEDVGGVDYYDLPDSSKVIDLVKDITKIRNEMLANKKIELMRSRVTFKDLLRGVKEQEKQGSDSDTYTDGTCALLRRKMQKMRKQEEPEQSVEVTLDMGQGVFKVKPSELQLERKRHSYAQSALQVPKVQRLPTLPTNRSFSSTSVVARQHTIMGDPEEDMKRQLVEQEKHQTELKVAKETAKYRGIQKRIGNFLKQNSQRVAYPVLYQEDCGT